MGRNIQPTGGHCQQSLAREEERSHGSGPGIGRMLSGMAEASPRASGEPVWEIRLVSGPCAGIHAVVLQIPDPGQLVPSTGGPT